MKALIGGWNDNHTQQRGSEANGATISSEPSLASYSSLLLEEERWCGLCSLCWCQKCRERGRYCTER
jgi:hypothetical protein